MSDDYGPYGKGWEGYLLYSIVTDDDNKGGGGGGKKPSGCGCLSSILLVLGMIVGIIVIFVILGSF